MGVSQTELPPESWSAMLGVSCLGFPAEECLAWGCSSGEMLGGFLLGAFLMGCPVCVSSMDKHMLP